MKKDHGTVSGKPCRNSSALNQTAVSVPIFVLISMDGSKKPIEAFARTEVSPLACHPVVRVAGDPAHDGAWYITHRHTGLAVNPSRTYCREDALALIDVYLPLTDWASIASSNDAAPIRGLIEAAYEQFVPPSCVPLPTPNAADGSAATPKKEK